LAIEQVQIEGEVLDPSGGLLPLDWSLRINGLLIGLKDDNDDTLVLGMTRNYVSEKKVIVVFTPHQEIQKGKTIQFSTL
jgi:hypothetical protein